MRGRGMSGLDWDWVGLQVGLAQRGVRDEVSEWVGGCGSKAGRQVSE